MIEFLTQPITLQTWHWLSILGVFLTVLWWQYRNMWFHFEFKVEPRDAVNLSADPSLATAAWQALREEIERAEAKIAEIHAGEPQLPRRAADYPQ